MSGADAEQHGQHGEGDSAGEEDVSPLLQVAKQVIVFTENILFLKGYLTNFGRSRILVRYLPTVPCNRVFFKGPSHKIFYPGTRYLGIFYLAL